MFNLEEIKDPSFLKDLTVEELEELAKEIRDFIIEKVSVHGGHLSGNLGIVDLTIALNKFFSNGEKFIYDVGHQMYTHKILTGRAKDFDNLREMNGLSGFSQPQESSSDLWEVGHSSTSLAALAGMLENDENVIAIIGDGALTSGEAYEGLEYLSTLHKKAIIIINDNEYSISKNVGSMQKILDELRSTRSYSKRSAEKKRKGSYVFSFLERIKSSVKGLFYQKSVFDSFGFKYYGPIDGHNYKEMFKYFEYANNQNIPTIIHVVTKKGKGYKFPEEDKIGRWHSVPPFNIETGDFVQKEGQITYVGAVSEYLEKFYEKHKDLKVVNPAMTFSSSMVNLQKIMGKNYIDPGIAEQFALSFSASLAKNSKYVFTAIYSSFLQRAYDQLHQDVCLQNLHVVFGVDKAGLTGEEGKTHQGIYDISYLRTIPNIIICAPKDYKEVFELMDYALTKCDGPVAIHYPKTTIQKIEGLKVEETNITEEWINLTNKKDPAAYVLTYSSLVDYVMPSLSDLNVDVINARFIKPIDEKMLKEIAKTNKTIIVYEEAIETSALGDAIIYFFNKEGINNRVIEFGYPLSYFDFGKIEDIRKLYKMDRDSIREKIIKLL